MSTPALYIFAISHYCEKARWALDYLGIDYRLEYLAPGPHIKFARELGVADTSLPILVDADLALQGSAQIIDWALQRSKDTEFSLATDDEQASREIEQRLDKIFGVHVRRYYYSDALITHPENVRPMFSRHLAWQQKLVLRIAWGEICKRMIKGLDLGSAQRVESRQIVEAELDWLDGLLADGRQYLVGENFSRTDVSAASLLSPLALPPEHPTYNDLQVPSATAADFASWQQRPGILWAREMHKRYRKPGMTAQ
jgi:glutathione S-transferase